MNIIMLGAQGTGKGTVAGLISEQTGLPQISTGDIFRANISEKTELGIKANEYISKGQLVPDEITVPMVINRLEQEDCKCSGELLRWCVYFQLQSAWQGVPRHDAGIARISSGRTSTG